MFKGYCKLCRQYEITKYGTLVTDDKQHEEACKEAGCKHPALYEKLPKPDPKWLEYRKRGKEG